MTYKKCQVVMLPTNQKAQLSILRGKLYSAKEQLISYFPRIDNDKEDSNQHLYIISDDKIENDDWFVKLNTCIQHSLFEVTGSAFKNKEYLNSTEANDCFKVIASTDPSLNLPSPSPEFLQIYCEKQPEEVMVKYVGNLSPDTNDFDGTTKLVVSNNQISIKEIKQSYSRKEVEKLMKSSFQMGETWGVTYSYWFEPTEQEHKDKIQKCINTLLK